MSLSNEDLEKMRTLWESSDLSSEEIARQFGRNMTRNVVIGHAHRRHWKSRTQGPQRRAGSDEVSAEKQDGEKAMPQVERPSLRDNPKDRPRAASIEGLFDATPKSLAEPTPFAELRPSQCRWPVGRDADGHVFCPHPALDGGWMQGGSPYCESHTAKAGAGFRYRTPLAVTKAESW